MKRLVSLLTRFKKKEKKLVNELSGEVFKSRFDCFGSYA